MVTRQHAVRDFVRYSGLCHVAQSSILAESMAQAQGKFDAFHGTKVATAILLIPCFHDV